MEKEEIKKKITLKAETNKSKKLILKKSFIYNIEAKNTLTLKKEYQEKKSNSYDENIINFDSTKNSPLENIISCTAIAKSFDGRPILKNINFNLQKGQILGLLGPNGSGKTTLFRCLAGELKPDRGNIFLENKSILNLPIHERARKGISFLQQHKGLFENLTAYENLYAVLEIYIEDKNKIEKRIFELLSYFGLQYLSDTKAKFFSGGEIKKVSALQRVCISNLKVLLMDEPCSALDPISINSIKNFILELKRMGLSIILTEHNIAAIHDILDYCIIIRDGNIMAEGTMPQLQKNKDAIKYYLGKNFRI